jgi:hypothetical protein
MQQYMIMTAVNIRMLPLIAAAAFSAICGLLAVTNYRLTVQRDSSHQQPEYTQSIVDTVQYT